MNHYSRKHLTCEDESLMGGLNSPDVNLDKVRERLLTATDEERVSIVRELLRRCTATLAVGMQSYLKESDTWMPCVSRYLSILRGMLKRDPNLFPNEPQALAAISWASRGQSAMIRDTPPCITQFLSAFAILLGPTMCDQPVEADHLRAYMETLRVRRLRILPPLDRSNNMRDNHDFGVLSIQKTMAY